MGGPGVAVLVPENAQDIVLVVGDALGRFAAHVDRTCDGTAWELRDGDGFPYDCDVELWPSEWYDADLAQFDPHWIVTLAAGVNDPSCHEVLGRIAADLATRTSGWVDLGGPIGPLFSRLGGSEEEHPILGPRLYARRRQVIAEYLDALSLPGEVRAVEYETAGG